MTWTHEERLKPTLLYKIVEFLLTPRFSNRRPGVRHSTFESLRLGRSSQSIASGFLRFWDSLNFKKDKEFVGITVLFLDEKVARCSSMYMITDHPFLIRFISLTIIDEVITGAPEINLQSKLECSTIANISELISPFQAEQQMEANFSGSSSTSRQNQKIDVGGRLIKGILRRCETVQPDFIFCTA
uniref:DUF223 domain-containing protein n=1 Tax=Brassica oleracea var. oleracea TaxID=109376 RepID=A0A0D3CEM0_BRAOL